MSRPAVLLLGLAAVTAATVVVAVLAAGGDGSEGRLAARPLAASAGVTPAQALFGEPVTARVDVVADRRVDPESIRVEADFRPFRVESRRVRRTEADGLTRIEERFELSCLVAACLPPTASGTATPVRTVQLPDVTIGYEAGGAAQELALELPPVELASRLSPEDRAKAASRLRVPAEVPPVTYAVSPGSLSTGLFAAAGALLALALALVLLAARGRLRRSRRREDARGPLARALAAVREAAARGDVRRLRAALGWLARELRSSGREDVADDALRLAWSLDPPERTAVAALARAVEEDARDGR